MMPNKLPQRLNLAIARRCFLSCPGCFTYFGENEPNLEDFERCVRKFIDIGIDKVTLSGGDPLTIDGLIEFLIKLRNLGVRDIKVDIGGGACLKVAARQNLSPNHSSIEIDLDNILEVVDFLGIPLDGWSNESVELFRSGRKFLFDELEKLLDQIDKRGKPPNVFINTVAHRGNIEGLEQILRCVLRHDCVYQWNIFQYTPTDQASNLTNNFYRITDKKFAEACGVLEVLVKKINYKGLPAIQFMSKASRLGEYLLINSDGEAWLPNEFGQTLRLGNVVDGEKVVLQRWNYEVNAIIGYKKVKKESTLNPLVR